MTPNYDIHPITLEQPLKDGEVFLTNKEAEELLPMNRQERREWAKKHGKFSKLGER